MDSRNIVWENDGYDTLVIYINTYFINYFGLFREILDSYVPCNFSWPTSSFTPTNKNMYNNMFPLFYLFVSAICVL